MAITGTQIEIDDVKTTILGTTYVPLSAVTIIPQTRAERATKLWSSILGTLIILSGVTAVIGLAARIIRWGFGY